MSNCVLRKTYMMSQMRKSDKMRFIEVVPKRDGKGVTRLERKRARSAVVNEPRKRTRHACEVCHLKKERCDGGIPCHRCINMRCECKPRYQGVCQESELPEMSNANVVASLRNILSQHFDLSALNDDNLISLAQSLRHLNSNRLAGGLTIGSDKIRSIDFGGEKFTVKVLSESKTCYTGENSLLNLSQTIRHAIAEKMHADDTEGLEDPILFADSLLESKKAEVPLQSLRECLACLPPRDIADFLAQAYFMYARSNVFTIDEEWFYSMMDICYNNPSQLTREEIPTVSSVLMVLAIGTQFAHMSSESSVEDIVADRGSNVSFSEDSLGRAFFHQVSSMLSDIIEIRSFVSVQLCLLVAGYLMPFDTPGLSYTYFGLGIHIALQNGMHRKSYSSLSPRTQEVRKRVWWSLYTLYQRTLIFHGHPKTLSSADVDVEKPVDIPELRSQSEYSSFKNESMLIEITLLLEAVANEISLLRKVHNAENFFNLFSLRQKLIDLMDKLPRVVNLSEDNIQTSVLRLNIHLCLHYWHTRLFLGRPFLLVNKSISALDKDGSSSTIHSGRETLVQDSVHAALEIINLCQVLQARVGLARASYGTEFTSCRAAMLVLLARSLTDRSSEIRHSLAAGLRIIKVMGMGSGIASSQAYVIQALEQAINRMSSSTNNESEKSFNESTCSYNRFKDWQILWQNSSGSSSKFLAQSEPSRDHVVYTGSSMANADIGLGTWHSIQSFDNIFESLPLELNEFNLIPDIDFLFEENHM